MAESWSTLASMPTARYGLAAARDSSGRVYAVGGYDPSIATTYATVERFDPGAGSWSTLTSMPTARYYVAGATDSSGRIYVLGGINASSAVVKTVERFDPSSGAWTTLAPMANARRGLAAATDSTGRIYALGGRVSSALNTVERFDPTSGAWTTLTAMSSTRQDLAAAADSAGRIYAIGGQSSSGVILNTVERFDPTSGAWTTIAPLSAARSQLTAAVDSSGRIYAIGGFTSSAVAAVERFDPSTGVWTTLTSMPTARSYLAGASDSNGRVYALGGSTSTAVATVERLTINSAPNAPALTSPANNTPIDKGSTQRFAWTFSDPDPGDSQSQFDLQYRLVGGSTWTTVSSTTPNQFYDFAAGTFAAGNYEWQVRTYDSQGAVGPWSSSSFFTAATAPATPTITAPVNGSTVPNTATLTWSAPNQTDYQWRRVADNAGAANTSVVYADSGDVVDGVTRSATVAFDTNNRWEHLQVRIKNAGLWSAWADARVLVSYTPPTVATFTMTGSSSTATRTLSITNPAPGTGVPATSYVDVYCRTAASSTVLDTYRPYSATGVRIATALATNTAYVDRNTAGSPVVYEYRVVSVASNGTTSDSGWASTA